MLLFLPVLYPSLLEAEHVFLSICWIKIPRPGTVTPTRPPVQFTAPAPAPTLGASLPVLAFPLLLLSCWSLLTLLCWSLHPCPSTGHSAHHSAHQALPQEQGLRKVGRTRKGALTESVRSPRRSGYFVFSMKWTKRCCKKSTGHEYRSEREKKNDKKVGEEFRVMAPFLFEPY